MTLFKGDLPWKHFVLACLQLNVRLKTPSCQKRVRTINLHIKPRTTLILKDTNLRQKFMKRLKVKAGLI